MSEDRLTLFIGIAGIIYFIALVAVSIHFNVQLQ